MTSLPDAGTQATAAQHRSRARSARGRGLLFLGKRALFYVGTAFVAIILNFMIPRFMPGDPAKALALQIQQQTGTQLSPEAMQAIYSLYGDPQQNLFQQFVTYLGDVLHGDFGISVASYPTPVATLIGQALPWTLLLVGTTTLLAWLIGTALGAWVGWKPGSALDNVLTPMSTFFSSFPAFWVAMQFLSLFAFQLGWFPRSGGYDPNYPYDPGNFWFWLGVLQYGALPAFTLIFVGFAGWLFGMRNMMVTTISEDYVTLAKAKGLSENRVMFRYAARNALLPNITNLAMAMGSIVGGVVLSEIVFTYPGIGTLLVNSIVSKDFPVMQTIFLMIVLAVLVANFIADSLYVVLDPRTRETK